jgi:hypothetical protein
MFGFIFGKNLKDVLNKTRNVRVHGVFFTIRKINILDYLDGSKAVQKQFDIYQTGNQISEVGEKKIREHMSHVLVAGVVSPKLSFKQEQDFIFIDNLFTDWSLAVDLYKEILAFTYGKKKVT